MKRVIVVDPEKCYACLQCVVSCGYDKANASYDAPLTGEILSEARLDVAGVLHLAVPVVCQHCEDAPCLRACPSGAIHRQTPDGPVLLDQAKCIGCRACVLACPFGMVWMNADGRVAQKCDQCIDRTAQGCLPACVEDCPCGALSLEPLSDIVKMAMERHAEALFRSR